jgi:uncharacterized membrane protein
MTRWIVAYVVALVVFGAGDFGWLSLAGPRLYRPSIGALLADKPDVRAAVAFYLLYILGVTVLAIAPGLRAGRPLAALGWGVVAGLFAYGTYDLTNQATLRGWPMRLTAADMAWGAAITGLAAFAGCLAASAVHKA